MEGCMFKLGERMVGVTPKVIEVRSSIKRTDLVVDFGFGDESILGLYRPEGGLYFSVDPRVLKPSELYRDVAFYRFFDWLGWDGVAPVFPWQLKPDDRGVLRPYWREVQNMEIYHFDKRKMERGNLLFWKRLALADYILGVGDRVSNDFLVTEDGLFVIDSGFSFLPGADFSYQQSLVREMYKGDKVDETLLVDLKRLVDNFDPQLVSGLVDEHVLFWVWERIKLTMSGGKFL